MLLSDFVGNIKVKNELNKGMKHQNLPHAIILEGDVGTGKKTLANIIAEYAVCSSKETKPCGQCSGCLKAQKHIHPDIFMADGNHSGELSIDSIRYIRSSAYIKANEAPNKVFILLNCEKMLVPAQNAFLKILEEPPENVMFLLTVSSAAALLQTIRSRTRILSLFPVSFDEAVKELQKRFPDKLSQEIHQAAYVGGGNIGSAIQQLENGGKEAMKLAQEIYAAIPLSKEYELLILTNQLSQSRAFAVSVTDCLVEIASEAVKASVGAETNLEQAKDAAKRIPRSRLFKIQAKAQEARNVLNSNVNMNFFCTWLCAALKS